jgi:hypothetical protein
MLWDKPVAIVAYSFGGLVFKSLVVEADKYVRQRPMNNLDFKVQKHCGTFLNNLKGNFSANGFSYSIVKQ